MSIFTLEQTVLHGLAKFCWGKLNLREDVNDLIYSSFHKLISYRDEVISKVPSILNSFPKTSSLTLPRQIIDKVINAVHNLYEGYYEAVDWELKFDGSLPFTILDPFTSRNYQAGNFIDANRHFNDFEWAKKFIADEDQSAMTRFKFACIYCFEEGIITLWNIIKNEKQLPCMGTLECMKHTYNSFIVLWAYNAEGKFHILVAEDDEFSSDGFFLAGLKKAFCLEYVYAMQYFWSHCSETEKAKFMNGIHYDNIWFNRFSPNMSNFMYSILSKEQKQNGMHLAAEYECPFILWSNLLHSRFYEYVLEDILSFSSCVPLEVYGRLLDLLAEEIINKQLPIHKSIFKQIWHHLSNEQQIRIFEMEEHTILSLKKMISLDPTTISF